MIGQGSIGRRHAAILLELGHQVVTYDPSPQASMPQGALKARTLRDCLQGADAAVVASPSSEHVADAREAIELGVPVLVEKPPALDEARCVELECLAAERGVMLSVAMSMREHTGVRALADILSDGAVGEILRASVWCGSWLPGWRPGSDYRQSYSARAELGGGVLLDVAVHELDYLLWLTGPACSVSALARRVSELDTDVEDVALIAIELASGAVAEVTVDYFDRCYTRGCRIVGSEGTLHWSWEQQTLTIHRAVGASSKRTVPSDVAPAYRSQLQRFLAAVSDQGKPPVPADQARHVLAAVDAARASSRGGRRIALAPSLRLRAVGRTDVARLLEWRNDPDTRRWSRSSDPIAADEHDAWFERVLDDRSTRLWVAESEGEPVAQVRVGPRSDGAAEVHVTVAPGARGRGVGAAAIMQAAGRALAEPGLELLLAHVKPEHSASLRAFARAGFIAGGQDDAGLIRLERQAGGRTVVGG